MSSKKPNEIGVYFKFDTKLKILRFDPKCKISQIIERLTSISKNKDKSSIQLFYGGRFLNPNFTLDKINYIQNKSYPKYV